ncbi:MAG: Fe-S cluster assembly protein SufD [Limisphaerales bacterium]
MTQVVNAPMRKQSAPDRLPHHGRSDDLLNKFRLLPAELNPPWLKVLRASALNKFITHGLPSTKDEEWKFTNVAPILELSLHGTDKPARNVSEADIKPFLFGDLNTRRIVFIDGHFAPELSNASGNGVDVLNLRSALTSPWVERNLARHASFEENGFAALNTALFQDGVFVSIPGRRVLERPIHILHIVTEPQSGAVFQPRNLIVAGDGSSAKVIESYVTLGNGSAEPYLTNAVTELILGEDALVEHCKFQAESEKAFHIASIQAHQARSSVWTSHSISTGARIARNQIQTVLADSGAQCTMNGLYLGRGEQLVDHHTVMDHSKPHCESHEYYHGILSDRARGVFNGKIFVRKDAQKTNAKQTNRNLLLSDDAVIDTKPQLEIFADDVKCTHGATVGQLDEKALFYLQARGIPIAMARRMLIYAFASEVIERISLPEIREELDKVLLERFAS